MDNFDDFLDNFEVVDECSGSEDGAEEEPAVPDNKPTEGEIEEFLENVKGFVTCGGLPESEEQTEVVPDDFHKEIRVPEQPAAVDEFHEECSDPASLTQLPPTSRSINLVDDTLVCTINNNKVSSLKSRVTYKPGGTIEKTIINDTETVLVDPSPVDNESESIREVVVSESLDVHNNLYLEEEDGLGSSYNVVDSYECVSSEELTSKLDEEAEVNEENLSIFGLSPESTVEEVEDLRDHLNLKRQARMDEVCEGEDYLEVEPTNLLQSKPDENSRLKRESRPIKRRLSPCSRRRQSILRSIEERAGGRESLSPALSHSRHVSRSGSSRSFSEASKRPRIDQGTKKQSPSNESLLRSVEKKLESLEREASLIDKALSKSISAERRRKSSKEDWKSSSRDRTEQHRRRKSPPPARYERSRRTSRSPKGHIHSHSSSQRSYPKLSHLPKRSLKKVEETKLFCAKLREIAVGGTMNSGLYCPPGPYQSPPAPYGSAYTQPAVPGMEQYQGYGAHTANPTYSMHHGGGGYPMQSAYPPPRPYYPPGQPAYPSGQPAYPPGQPAYTRAEVPQPWPRPRYAPATSAPQKSASRSRSRSPKKKKSKKRSRSRERRRSRTRKRSRSKERRATRSSSVELVEVRTRKRTTSPAQASKGPKRYLIIDPSRIPTPPPPPVLSSYNNENSSTPSSSRQDDSMGMQKQGKENISLSSLLEAAIMDKPGDGSSSPCDSQMKKDILNNCETIIRRLYQKRTSGPGAFIPDALEEDMQVGVQCSPLVLWHPSLSFNEKTNAGKKIWHCSDVEVPEVKKISFKSLRPNVSLGFGFEKKEVAKKCVELKQGGNTLPPGVMVPVHQPPPLNVPPPVVFTFDQPPPVVPVVPLTVPPPVQTTATQPPQVAQVPNYPPPFSVPPMFNPPPAMSGYNQSIPVHQQVNLVSYPSRITSSLPYYTDTGVIDKTKNVMYPLPSYSNRSEIMDRGRHLEVINLGNPLGKNNQEKLGRKSPEISRRRSVEQIHRNKSPPKHKSKRRSIERRSSERIKGSIERGRRSIERARKSLERSIKRIEEERVSSESRLKSVEWKRYSAERGRKSVERARRSMEKGKLSAESRRGSIERARRSMERGKLSVESSRGSTDNIEDKRKFIIERDKRRMDDRPKERDLRNIEARRLSDEKGRGDMERTRFGGRDRESPGRHQFEKKTFNRPRDKTDRRNRSSQEDVVRISSDEESNTKGLNLFKLCSIGSDLGAIQQKSLLYTGIIESLQKNIRTYKRLYTYQNNVLCKIEKGFSKSVVIPRDNLKEFMALLHKKFHDLTADEIMTVKQFVYPPICVNLPKVVAKVFSECPNCKDIEPNKVEPLIDKKPAKKLVKAERKMMKDEGEEDIDFREKSPRYMRETEDDYSRYDNMSRQIGSTNTPSGYERATKTKPLFELLRRKEPSPQYGVGLHESLLNDAPLVFKNKPEMVNPVVDVTADVVATEVVSRTSDNLTEKPESTPSSQREEIVISDEEKRVDSENTNHPEGSIESEPDVEIISLIEPTPSKPVKVRGKENPNLVLINTKQSNKPVSTPTNLVKPPKPTKTVPGQTGRTSKNLKKYEQIKTEIQPDQTSVKIVTAEESKKKSADSNQTVVNIKDPGLTKAETSKPSSKSELQKTKCSRPVQPSKNIVKESEQIKTKSQPIQTSVKIVTAEESEKKSADSSQTKTIAKESVVTKTDSTETIKPTSKCEVQKTNSSSGKSSKNIVKESEQTKPDPSKDGQSDANVKQQVKVESNQIVGNKQEDAAKDAVDQSDPQKPVKVEEEKPKGESGLDFKGKLRAMQTQSKGYAGLISRLEGGEKDKEYLLKGGMLCKKISKPDGRTEVKILAPEDSVLEVIHIVHTMSAVHTPHSKVITFFSKHFTPVDNLESQAQQVIANCAQCKKS